MGGPINGVSWSSTIFGSIPGVGPVLAELGDALEDIPPNPLGLEKSYAGIIIPTVLQTSIDVIEWFTNLTCLYDRYWDPEASEKVTLPICVFHVTKVTPTRSVEVSDQRVLLYEQGGDVKEPWDAMRPNTMRAIIDNVVKKPTVYSVEAVVPFQPGGKVVSALKMATDVVSIFSEILGPSVHMEAFEGIFGSVFSALGTVSKVADTLGKLPGTDGVSYINMNSLEAMADGCRTVCMKMWTGYEYRYGLISGMTHEKRPLEDDVFRVSFTLQEMPVLTLSPPEQKKPYHAQVGWTVKNTAASAQEMLAKPLIDFTGVREAAGEGASAYWYWQRKRGHVAARMPEPKEPNIFMPDAK